MHLKVEATRVAYGGPGMVPPPEGGLGSATVTAAPRGHLWLESRATDP